MNKFLKKSLMPLIWAVALGIAFVNVSSGIPIANKIIGAALVALTLVITLSYKGHPLIKKFIPSEIRLFALFILMSLIFGYIGAINKSAVIDATFLLVQIWLLSLAVILSVFFSGNPTHIFYLVYAIPILQIIYIGFVDGWNVIFDLSNASRISVETMNPNLFGRYMLSGVIAFMFLFFANAKKVQRWLLVIPMPFIIFALLQSGSRKALIAALIAVFAWLLLCYLPSIRKGRFLNIVSALVTITIVLTAIYYINEYVLPESIVGTRLTKLIEDPQSNSRARVILYEEALDRFTQQPIFGVGLDNFQYLSSLGKYTHSEFAEILVATGIVGAGIYFPIYILLWIKMSALARTFHSFPKTSYTANIFRVAIIVDIFLGFGTPNYNDIFHWIVFAAALGYHAFVVVKIPVTARTVSLGSQNVRSTYIG